MKFLSWNVNGIRAIHKSGFLDWMAKEKADFYCLQEIKAHPDQLNHSLVSPLEYYSIWHPAQKKGYSGVAIFAKDKPLEIQKGVGDIIFDSEGRVLTIRFKKFSLVNIYFPNSQREHARLPYKLAFCSAISKFLETEKKKSPRIIICGDFNIAHKEIDLKNPKANQNNAGFLPEERSWLDRFLMRDFVDGFRMFEKGPGHYTWWSYRPGVREKNIGWRLDYFMVTRELVNNVKAVWHQPLVFGSDHCPVGLELEMN